MNDDQELNNIMEKRAKIGVMNSGSKRIKESEIGPFSDDDNYPALLKGICQWTTGDGRRFIPSSATVAKIPPGVYEIEMASNIGLYFELCDVNTDGLIRFPQTNSDRVVNEIAKFWERGDLFKEYRLTHKRGIILWGPPGGGKSCTIQLIMQDVIARKGIVVKFTMPKLFTQGIRSLREIERETPIVVLMEDIDSIIRHFSESEVLNILDGVDQIDRCVFLATTNYPEELGPRILNRPSRFDKRFKIGMPNAESRLIYLKHIIKEPHRLNIDLDKWVVDTEGFSLAHIKELFVAVVILEDDYDAAISTLSSMREKIDSLDDDGMRGVMGFSKYTTSSEGYNGEMERSQ